MMRTLFIQETEAKCLEVTHDLSSAIRIQFDPPIDQAQQLTLVMTRDQMETLHSQIGMALRPPSPKGQNVWSGGMG